MRIIRPITTPTTPKRSGRRSASKPQWWRKDRARFVLLACGCKTDISIKGMIVLQTFGKRHIDVFCEKCETFARVEKSLTLLEYFGIQPPTYSEDPLF